MAKKTWKTILNEITEALDGSAKKTKANVDGFCDYLQNQESSDPPKAVEVNDVDITITWGFKGAEINVSFPYKGKPTINITANMVSFNDWYQQLDRITNALME